MCSMMQCLSKILQACIFKFYPTYVIQESQFNQVEKFAFPAAQNFQAPKAGFKLKYDDSSF